MPLDGLKLDRALASAAALSTRMALMQTRMDATFVENDHPRASDGKFGSGGGSTRPGVEHGKWEEPKSHRDGGKTHRFPVRKVNGKTGYHQVHEHAGGGATVEKSGGYVRDFPSVAEAKRYVEETP